MNLTQKTLLAIAFGLLLPSAQAADANVATVNGKPIKQSLVDYIAKDATARGQNVDANVRSVIVNKLISSELVVQEAQKQGMDKQPDYVAKEELLRRELLVNTYIENFLKKTTVSEADLKAEYDKFKQQVGDKEYSARHILVATEAEAKDIIAQLGKGGDFAKLAKEKSKDTGSKDKGGELGWFPPAAMVKPFSDALGTLKKGQITQSPVQTQFGWHVIKLDDTRTAQPPAYDKVKDNLKKQVQQRNLEKMLSDLRAKAKVVAN
ncbi:peptidylprolyl isomerase [Methylobacillus sp. MM3]|uniref:peptidylprolyl isomerase n=1 Tax=Methylobacillus sp. MM3 TaxID=1848039 RepID=UPI0007E03B8E|nr:peptidylprolyl isomerase [Methylobacillus sp. MM3]OAJ71060.1 peptidylprolyl isomerase [Methylobacillus sp. MM3]